VQARGYDDLSAETRSRVEGAHVGSLDPETLRAALAASVKALIHEGKKARLANAEVVVERLAELAS
jgi:hypothetical protein